MNLLNITALTLTLATSHAYAQVPARPGHEPGVGVSLPLSGTASNIVPTDSPTSVAPTLPASGLGPDSTPQAYLQQARADLVATGHTGRAQEAMEMAETRALTRSVQPDQAGTPDASMLVQNIRDARMALGHADIAGAIRLIDAALAS